MAAAPASSLASETVENKKSYLFSVIYKISSKSLKKIAEAIVFLLSNPVKIIPERKTGRLKQYAPPYMCNRFGQKSGKAGAQSHAAGDDGCRCFNLDAGFCADRI
ncbi:hypothetical protein [Agrobacterium tumefaciens]|uniref:hypothetical protein n=1 Tax=Agrobacterium tumefaciens TaxID=358 RepID=UPI0027E552A6|nr:hypothetical protein [Agrobacterium tumefaciens]